MISNKLLTNIQILINMDFNQDIFTVNYDVKGIAIYGLMIIFLMKMPYTLFLPN